MPDSPEEIAIGNCYSAAMINARLWTRQQFHGLLDEKTEELFALFVATEMQNLEGTMRRIAESQPFLQVIILHPSDDTV